MRKLISIFSVLLFPLVADAQPTRDSARYPAIMRGGICVPSTASSTVLQATTGTDADSGAIGVDTCYMLEGDSDAWAKWGTSAVTASAGDQIKLRADNLYVFCTHGLTAVQYLSLLSVAVNGDWRLLVCQ